MRAPRGLWVATLLALPGSLLAACTSGHTVLGTGSSACFKALPVAADAVHRSGSLVGVRRVTLRQVAPRLAASPSLHHERNDTVCAVAYKGSYTRASVESGRGRPSGTLAVVVVRANDNKLVATLVFERLPLRFRHLGLF